MIESIGAVFIVSPRAHLFGFSFLFSKPFELGEVGDGLPRKSSETPRKMDTVGSCYFKNYIQTGAEFYTSY